MKVGVRQAVAALTACRAAEGAGATGRGYQYLLGVIVRIAGR